MSFLQDPDWGECCEPILLSPSNPNAELIEISGYTLVYCSGACPKIYRVYKRESMLGLVFEHLTHWTNEIDEKQYAKPFNAAVALDDFFLVASMTNATPDIAA
ncbi:hypothetical protein [Anabaena sp. FACHB-83]|uniref:hypothetical protein n=1 Tax=Anabaena sp. FACHB-83 TaxID=2692772 RepID=UPI00168C04EB|nr:hypothetical protein [Anabaena sp. FACHB-83]MBD2480355.1 hypothetical protein [Anabaena sp. FACHB-83]